MYTINKVLLLLILLKSIHQFSTVYQFFIDQKISNEFALVKTLIMGKEFWQKNVPLVTIGFDNHSEYEIPPSVKHRVHFKLPSQIDDLCFTINPGDCSNIHDYKNNFHIGHTADNIDELKSAIEKAEISHRKEKMPKVSQCYYLT